jgi:hypothetical protein
MYLVKRFQPINDALRMESGKSLEVELIEGKDEAVDRAMTLTATTHWPHIVINAAEETAVCTVEYQGPWYGINVIEY